MNDLILPKNQFRISITSACNMKCVYCHNEGNTKCSVLTIDKIRKLIEETYEFGLEEIRLTGGDPLIHPQLYNICEMIAEEFNLRIGINTNLIAYEKLKVLIDKGWIHRVVVGLDYFDGKISKNSPIGKSSKEILENILKIKDKVDVSIATVFNGDYDNIYSIVKWGIENGVRVKVIEIERNEICKTSDKDYLEMRDKLINSFDFDIKVDDLEEINCYINNKKCVSFFPSLCRLRRCDLCKKIQLRVTSQGQVKSCLYYDDGDFSCYDEEVKNNVKKLLKSPVNYHYDPKLVIREENE